VSIKSDTVNVASRVTKSIEAPKKGSEHVFSLTVVRRKCPFIKQVTFDFGKFVLNE